jgi:hypothetical protein
VELRSPGFPPFARGCAPMRGLLPCGIRAAVSPLFNRLSRHPGRLDAPGSFPKTASRAVNLCAPTHKTVYTSLWPASEQVPGTGRKHLPGK